MQGYCGITGEKNCKCGLNRNKISILQVDFKLALFKLFTDHAVFDKFVINAILDNSPDLPFLVARLKQNQFDIGDQLKPIIGNDNDKIIVKLLLQHIETAAETIKAIRDDNNKKFNSMITQQMNISAEIGKFLNTVNPEGFDYLTVKELLDMHNKYIIEMALAHKSGDHKKEYQIYDAYYNEMLAFAFLLYDGFK